MMEYYYEGGSISGGLRWLDVVDGRAPTWDRALALGNSLISLTPLQHSNVLLHYSISYRI